MHPYVVLGVGLFFALILAGLPAVAAYYFDSRRRIERGQYPTAADALRALVEDIQSAEKRVVLVAPACGLRAETNKQVELMEALKEALDKAAKKGVEVFFVTAKQPSALVEGWAAEKLLRIKLSLGDVPFNGRIVDDKIVVIRTDDAEFLGQDGTYKRAGRAPSLVEYYLDITNGKLPSRDKLVA